MRLGQLSEAAIYAIDLDAAKRFYQDVLGLEIISRMENRGIVFRCGATVCSFSILNARACLMRECQPTERVEKGTSHSWSRTPSWSCGGQG